MAIKLFIDQGHNPQNPNSGAEANGVREQDITYDIGVRLAALLRADPNFEVMLSRNYPQEQLGTSNATSLQARVYAANTWGADYFISLHCNASTNTAASGSEAYVYSETTPAYGLGQQILEGLHDMTGLANRGVFVRPGLYVLRATSMLLHIFYPFSSSICFFKYVFQSLFSFFSGCETEIKPDPSVNPFCKALRIVDQ